MSFDNIWENANFKNTKLKSDNNIKETLRKVYTCYLDKQHIKFLGINDIPECSPNPDDGVVVELNYQNLVDGETHNIQMSIELPVGDIPYSVNF